MKTFPYTIIVVFTLYNILPCYFGHEWRRYDKFIFQAKQFVTQCILGDAVDKLNTKELVEKMRDVDNNDIILETCFQQWDNSITELEKLREGGNQKGPVKLSESNSEHWTTTSAQQYCKAANAFTECLQPVQDTFLKCKHKAGTSFFALVKEVCKDDGIFIAEFDSAINKWCLESESPRVFDDCMQKNFYSKGRDLRDYIANNTCKAASDFKDCGLNALDQCKSQEPKTILEKYLNELKKESIDAQKCVFQDFSQQEAQIPSTSASPKKTTKFNGSGIRNPGCKVYTQLLPGIMSSILCLIN